LILTLCNSTNERWPEKVAGSFRWNKNGFILRKYIARSPQLPGNIPVLQSVFTNDEESYGDWMINFKGTMQKIRTLCLAFTG